MGGRLQVPIDEGMPLDPLVRAVTNGTTALLIIVAVIFGLILPRPLF